MSFVRAVALVLVLALVGCGEPAEYPAKDITIVIPMKLVGLGMHMLHQFRFLLQVM